MFKKPTYKKSENKITQEFLNNIVQIILRNRALRITKNEILFLMTFIDPVYSFFDIISLLKLYKKQIFSSTP